MKLEELKERLENVEVTSKGYKASCPICDKGTTKQHLLLSQATNRIGLYCCKNKCDGKIIMGELGLTIADIYDNPNKPNNTDKPKKEIVATYDYKDETGNLVFQVVRFKPKDFLQRKPMAEGKWEWNLKGIVKVPYHLPELIANIQTEQIENKKTVYIVEGEKDADNLMKLGFLATCNAGGGGKWEQSYNQYFRDCSVIIFPDKDETGRRHGEIVSNELNGVASSIKVIEMPDIEGRTIKDVSDFIEAGKTKEDIDKLVNDAPLYISTIFDLSNAPADAVEIPNPPPPLKAIETIEAYYDSGKKEYLLKNQRGAWLPLNESQFKKELRSKGMSHKENFGELSDIDKALIKTRNENDIVYAGKIAGYKAGYYQAERILVTESPKIIEPFEGEWKTLKSFFDGLLQEDGLNQQQYFYGWLKVGYEALRAGQKMTGQALVICGKAGCGKSLLQKIITEIMGGRYAKPYQYMSGRSNFNADLFGAEHLMIEDETASTDIKTRRDFGCRIKDMTVNESQKCHAKGRDGIPMKPFWRLSISLNDESENLSILPPIDESIEDKLIILRAHKTEMTMPTNNYEARQKFWNELEKELPAFLNYLVQMEIPEELLSERYGIKHFHHIEIVNEINDLSPEAKLLVLIDRLITEEWKGTADDLDKALYNNFETQYESKKLLSWNGACGKYLGRLAIKYPERISRRHGEQRTWTIKPAPINGNDGTEGGTGGTLGTGKSQVCKEMSETFESPDTNATADATLSNFGTLGTSIFKSLENNIVIGSPVSGQGASLAGAVGLECSTVAGFTRPTRPIDSNDFNGSEVLKDIMGDDWL